MIQHTTLLAKTENTHDKSFGPLAIFVGLCELAMSGRSDCYDFLIFVRHLPRYRENGCYMVL